ncbi:AraC family transcriptional regulator [Achromobacter seleniivolatilans]|uniref:AraC family transcriptional regulator n=1 Tax=Achromobacter seleniivolatilans TaxID=3047478 RepID=A0ABY9M9K4_9BURK|nr:AraC family transcriptional regulator [Achromobacter sp. R39]WMD22873.1 AraC family transcriptional regulator [Achromobacter sp. R39]
MAVSQHIWHCGAGLPGDVLIADLRAYRYAPHFHDAWSIGAIEHGRCTFTVHGESYVAGEGDLVVIAPGQVHTGGTSAEPLAYRMAYIDAGWFGDHMQTLFADEAHLPGPVITSPGLCAQWLAALTPDAIADTERRERLSAALFALLSSHARGQAQSHSTTPAATDVCAMLRERMAADPACAPDLEALARAQDRHRTTLVKQFARRYGLPPQAWLRNWRVARARTLLRNGLPLAQAAQAVGFADQAHLTRVFKQVYGSTPGVLRRAGEGDVRTL